MDLSFEIKDNKWLASAQLNDKEIGYISGTATNIDSVYITEEYRGKGLCGKLLSLTYEHLDKIYTGTGIEDFIPTYTISLQGSDRMCYCLINTSARHNKAVIRDIDDQLITAKHCGDCFKRGIYHIKSIRNLE